MSLTINNAAGGKPKLRCAIYTRKSSEEGLEQDFNSLDAQNEACAAYIASQKHEGWKLVKQSYSDGGVSGGTLERPGLKALLGDIEAGKIDLIVVYKVDRLTRSLADFAKLVELMEAHSARFVSVTQSFNTTTSMGRLTLNMLLSFAQFEREVTAERIRDKIAASKKRGLWMGGVVPLGYEPHPDKTVRSLVVNKVEARKVQRLFELYDELGCLSKVEKQAATEGLRGKYRTYRTGRGCNKIDATKPIADRPLHEPGQRATGELMGPVLSRGAIHKHLTNPIYVGRIRHKTEVYDGLHDAIIDNDQWERVQQKLVLASAKRRGAPNGIPNASIKIDLNGPPLKGKLFDEAGELLTPSHSNKNGTRHRYYLSKRLIAKGKDPSGLRLPAAKVEQALSYLVLTHLDRASSNGTLFTASRITDHQALTDAYANWHQQTAKELATDQGRTQRILLQLIVSCRILSDEIEVDISPEVLARMLRVSADNIHAGALKVKDSFSMKKRGVEAKIVIGGLQSSPDERLIQALAQSGQWLSKMKTGETVKTLAQKHKCSEGYIRTRICLAFLSPKIQRLIVEGNQPAEMTLERFIRKELPHSWTQQEAMFLN